MRSYHQVLLAASSKCYSVHESNTPAQAFLSLAFGIESFIMSTHKKHGALDQSVHWMLALTMWACAISVILEMVWKRSVLASAARSLSCIVQGIWLTQVRVCCQDASCFAA